MEIKFCMKSEGRISKILHLQFGHGFLADFVNKFSFATQPLIGNKQELCNGHSLYMDFRTKLCLWYVWDVEYLSLCPCSLHVHSAQQPSQSSMGCRPRPTTGSTWSGVGGVPVSLSWHWHLSYCMQYSGKNDSDIDS